MTPTIKIVLAVLPFVIAVAVGMMYLQPALDEMTQKGNQVEEKKTEKEGLTSKLLTEGKIKAEKKALEKDIEGLRGAVPRTPDLELFNVDLERMCKESQVDLISIVPPKAEDSSSSSSSSSSTQSTAAAKEKLKAALGANTTTTVAATPNKPDAPAELGPDLEEVSRQVEVTGDYDGLMRLVHKLETYQRVIKITQMKEHVPKKETSVGKDKQVKLPEAAPPGDEDEVGDPKQLYVTMKITAYYLPGQ